MNEPIQILNADCMALMADVPDGYFDWAIVDPQYGINIGKNTTYGKRRKIYCITVYKRSGWDLERPTAGYWTELFRVSRNQVVFGANYFVEHLPVSGGWFFWDKAQPEGSTYGKGEFVFTSVDAPAKIARVSIFKYGKGNISNNVRMAAANVRIHQTQKPVEIYEWVYANYVKTAGVRVLDTHLGSGTHAVAAMRHNVSEFVGCEIDTEMYNKSLKLIANKTKQLRMEL